MQSNGWAFEEALMDTVGVPMTEVINGEVVCNINDSEA